MSRSTHCFMLCLGLLESRTPGLNKFMWSTTTGLLIFGEATNLKHGPKAACVYCLLVLFWSLPETVVFC